MNKEELLISNVIIDMTQNLYQLDYATAKNYTIKYIEDGNINLNSELVNHGKYLPYAINLGKKFNLKLANPA